MVESSSYYLMVATFLPLIFSPVAYFLGKRKGTNILTWLSFGILGLSTIFIIIPSLGLGSGGAYQEIYSWGKLGHFGLKLDGLSVPFAITIYVLSTAMVVYSKPYMTRKILRQYDQIKDNGDSKKDISERSDNEMNENFDIDTGNMSSTLVLSGDQKVYLDSQMGLYFALYLTFAMGMLGTVLATNLVEFYAFFELMLVPTFFLIAFFGYGNRKRVTFVFFLWSAVGALILLLALMAIGFFSGGFDYDIIKINAYKIPLAWIDLIIVSILIGFGIKLGSLFLHMWLPDTYTLSPTPISVLISSAMTGIGAYGIVRIWLDFLAAHYAGYGIYLEVWGVATMVFGGAMALMQNDIKKVLAYSSISSMGYILFGLGSESVMGISGAILLYVTHGLGKALLFMMAGSMILETGTRNLDKLGGLAGKMPYTAVFTMIGALTIMGVPITSGFMAEWVLFNGALQGAIVNHWDSIKVIAFTLAMLTTVLTSAYILWMYKRIFYGVVPESLKHVKESSGVIIITMGVLASFTLILGIYPDMFYKPIMNYVENLYDHHNGIVLIKQKALPSEIKASLQIKDNINDLYEPKYSSVEMHSSGLASVLHPTLNF
ncbi:MAG TPA: NADH-quinone oxidoreductase subunit M [Candidatus Nitrosocosmicus sp.]